MRKRMPYNNMRNNNMNRNNNRNNNNNMRRPMRGGYDEEEIHPRQRKHAQNMREKYLNQARDAQINGDRVQAEYWLQHAEHYSRVLNAINEMFAPAQHGGGDESGSHEGGHDEMSSDHSQSQGNHYSEGDEGMDGQPQAQQHQPRPPRQPRRPYQPQNQQQNQPQDGAPQEQAQGDGQRGGGRGQWRQPRPPREPRRPESVSNESTVPQEELSLPLAAVLPAARMDDDES